MFLGPGPSILPREILSRSPRPGCPGPWHRRPVVSAGRGRAGRVRTAEPLRFVPTHRHLHAPCLGSRGMRAQAGRSVACKL